MSRRTRWGTFEAVSVGIAVLAASDGNAYNSEEHKLVTDLAVADVTIDPAVVLPAPTAFVTSTTDSVLGEYKAAKEKAVGFQSNNEGDFNQDKKGPQDNSYWGLDFWQRPYNLKLWIPEGEDAVYLRARRLLVSSNLYGSARTFSIGELVALYGDYRRTTHCEGAACSLSNSDVTKSTAPGNTYQKDGVMFFKRGYNCFFSCGWEPTEIPAEDYLRFIGSGLVPPFNVAGNVAYNEDDYGEAGWWGDEMMRIATMNDWHFSTGAVAWYVGLHRLALLAVRDAVSNPAAWNKALHYEANALHSLTDLFAFGHVVVGRDETSWGVVEANSAAGSQAWTWMKNVVSQGGATRVERPCGRISRCMRIEFPLELAAGLPPLQDVDTPRADFMKSYVNSISGAEWASWANQERTYHDDFNVLGACVRNLNGNSFRILGDGRLHGQAMKDPECGASAVPGIDVLSAAVRTSIQSLFDAYVAIAQGTTTADELGSLGSSHFAALRYIPVFVHYDQNATIGDVTGRRRFNGQWTRFARAVDVITGAKVMPSDSAGCEMPYVNGDHPPPSPERPRCQEFPLIALPASVAVAPGETLQFVARGGTDQITFPAAPAWVWSLDPNRSGATIDPVRGVYTAGPEGGVSDVVVVTDTDGKAAKATVTITGTTSGTSRGCGCASGGSGAASLLVLALAAWGLRSRGRRR